MDNEEFEPIVRPKITFAWWNTALAPSAKSRKQKEDQDLVIRVLVALAITYGADFISLGEMSEHDLDYVASNFPLEGWTFESGVTSAGRGQFDLCYAYKHDVFEWFSIEDVTDTSYGATLKVAQCIRLTERFSADPLVIYASHWPSRLNTDAVHHYRNILCTRLRDAVLATKSIDLSQAQVIMMGDYNDEPYSMAMDDHLQASRDRDLVIKNQALFFNPSWAMLSGDGGASRGSYYWSKGRTAKWLTFDQIILTSNFLSGDGWQMRNTNSMVAEVPELNAMIKSYKSEFDHLPIFVSIEKEITHV
ncbi:endonuclease/exonuclease/phosphatase family protein [Pseudomonas monsensis]|uniref:endonuclease/exonuclease/phosphatase family protein n=1 Tax=Pseudomonas monsensis TaxID=2745509 RepID=UPI002AB82518|nr:endonuclease/exonuclease/phosphatase family protein [Pseudomonas monsensis]MDZ3826342.1 hypothetical protein [Pseudomonas monsensis]